MDLDAAKRLHAELGALLDLAERLEPIVSAWHHEFQDALQIALEASSGATVATRPDDTGEASAALQAGSYTDGDGTELPTRPCARLGCTETFVVSGRSGMRRYCSADCRKAVDNERHAVARRKRLNGQPPATEPTPEPPASPPDLGPLMPRHGSPFLPPRPAAVPPDERVTQALNDIGKLPPATAVFPPREPPPAVSWHPELYKRQRGVLV